MIIIKAARPVALLLIATQITTFMSANVMAEEQPYRDISETISGDLILTDKGFNDVDVLDRDDDKVMAMSADELPESYNSDIDNLEYVTPVKDQGNLGTCWSFSAMSNMETLLMKKYGDVKVSENNKGKYDLSEMHIVYALSNKLKDGEYGRLTGIDGGGNSKDATTYLTRERNEEKKMYNGPVYEEDFPYDGTDEKKEPYTDEEISEKIKAQPINEMPSSYFKLKLTNTYLEDDKINERNKIIKNVLLENGSVTVSINGLNKFYKDSVDGKKKVYYDNDPNSIPNHDVTIVGYDDNFSKDNFAVFNYSAGDKMYPSNPVHDGAFIVKNSWGKKWGNNGFYYMSYDSTIGEISSFGDLMERKDGYSQVYDYTPAGTPIRVLSADYHENDKFKSRDAAGTVFKREHPDTEESLTKIGIWTISSNTYIKLYVDSNAGTVDPDSQNVSDTFYDDLTAAPLKPINSNTIEEDGYICIEKPGYHIFDLKEPVKLTGESFTLCCDYASKTGELRQGSSRYSNESLICCENSTTTKNVNFNDGITFTYEFENNTGSDYGWDLLLKGFTEEEVKVTVNGSLVKTLPYNSVFEDNRTLYKKDGTDTYTQFDKQTPLTGNIDLYTADKIGIADITLTQQDGVKAEDDSTYVGTRIVGEIAKDAGGAKEVTSLGFTAYKDDQEVDAGEKNFKELYEELDGYTKKNEDSYIFTTPVMDKNNVDSVTFFGKFMQENNKEVVVNYINRKLQK